MVTVPESLLRRATAKIDSLDRELIWAHHEVALRDSLHQINTGEWESRLAEAYDWGDAGWARADSWWNQNKSAFWAVLGALAVALGMSI